MQWAVKQNKKELRYTLAKMKRQSLTSITGIDGAYWASCYINAEILPPFASDTRCTGLSFIFRTSFRLQQPCARTPSHCPFLIFLFNIPVRSCAASVYSLINGTSMLVSGNYIVLYTRRYSVVIVIIYFSFTPLSLSLSFGIVRGKLEGTFSYISSPVYNEVIYAEVIIAYFCL